jgi:hypothetical protein
MRRRVLATAVALTAAILGTLVMATPASAGDGQPACGSACDNKDPDTFQRHFTGQRQADYYLCDDNAVNIGSAINIDGSTFQLRYSLTCETTWVLYHELSGGFVITNYSHYSNGSLRLSSRGDGSGNWTLMLDDHGYTNNACISEYADQGATLLTTKCTASE